MDHADSDTFDIEETNASIQNARLCPISRQVMNDPVVKCVHLSPSPFHTHRFVNSR